MANLTLLDLVKRSGNDAQVGLVEAMTQENGLLKLMNFREIVGTSYKVKTRVTLPTVVTRAFNQGVTPGKSVITQSTYETKIFNSRSLVDVTEADTYVDGAAALRDEEDRSFIYATGNKFNSTCIYGDATTDPTEFDGISTILPSTAVSTVQTGTGASGSSTSLYFVAFNPAATTQGIMKGVEGVQTRGQGLSAVDMGKVLTADADSANYWAYCTEIQWIAGLAIYDTRSVGRYMGLTSAIAPTAAKIDSILTSMLPFRCSAILCNKTGLNLIKGLKSSITYIPADTELKLSPDSYNGIPILLDENITDTE